MYHVEADESEPATNQGERSSSEGEEANREGEGASNERLPAVTATSLAIQSKQGNSV